MNKWCGLGRLTKDPDVRTSGDSKVARYTLAINRRFSKNEETDFIPCVCFGKSAEFAEKYLKKGMKMAVVGRIQTGSYENKDGQKVYTTDIIVDEQDFAESKGSAENTTSNDNDFMDIPKSVADDMPF